MCDGKLTGSLKNCIEFEIHRVAVNVINCEGLISNLTLFVEFRSLLTNAKFVWDRGSKLYKHFEARGLLIFKGKP